MVENQESYVSYKPLLKTLVDKDLSLSEFQKKGLMSSRTQAKIKKNEPITLSTIISICHFLEVPIEQVVEVLPKDKSDK